MTLPRVPCLTASFDYRMIILYTHIGGNHVQSNIPPFRVTDESTPEYLRDKITKRWISNKQIFILLAYRYAWNERCCDRVVKVYDSKSFGFIPRRFESCQHRFFFCSLEMCTTYNSNDLFLFWNQPKILSTTLPFLYTVMLFTYYRTEVTVLNEQKWTRTNRITSTTTIRTMMNRITRLPRTTEIHR